MKLAIFSTKKVKAIAFVKSLDFINSEVFIKKMQVNLLPLHLFISVSFFVLGAFMYFLPRNPIFGTRSKYIIASDKLWSKYNKISGVMMSSLGALMFIGAANKRPLDISLIILFLSLGLIALIFFSKKDFEKAKANNAIDFDYDVQKSKTSNFLENNSDFVFSKANKVNIFYCLFCGFLIFVFYAWFRNVSGFMPEKLASHINTSGIVDGVILKKDLFLILNTLFGAILFLAVIVSFIFSRFFKDRKQTPFSLKVAPICTAIAFSTLCCGFIAQINYLIYAINLPSVDIKDFSFTLLLSYCASFSAIAILVAISSRNKRNSFNLKNKKRSKKSKRQGLK